MLCPSCRRQVAKGAPFCTACGAPIGAARVPLDLVLPDGTRVPVLDTVVIGRAAGSTIQIDNQTVSRQHARVVLGADGTYIEDAGSSHGTFVDGKRLNGPVRLRDGAQIRLGDAKLTAERRRREQEAGQTIVMRAGASLVVPKVGEAAVDRATTSVGMRPRIRSGWALKRLDAAEGSQRYVLKDLKGKQFVRMGDDEAEIFRLLDGKRTLVELVGEAEQRLGPGGSGRLARILADLGERGLLEGVEGAKKAEERPRGRLARLLKPREFEIRSLGRIFDATYKHGGFLLFTRPARIGLTAVAVGGIGSFAFLIANRYGTPFVVAKKIGLGGLVFLLGRFFVVAIHEFAHGLTVSSFGRTVPRAGIKLMFIFPFAFVETSDAYFEPRKRRFAISAAGPASDFVVGGSFALTALALSAGTMRDIFFQLAFAAYMGAFSNINPLLDRDGYHMLVDWLGQPGLRQRAREQLAQVLSGKRKRSEGERALTIYGFAAVGWSLAAVAFVIILSTRYYPVLTALAPAEVVWAVLGAFYLLMFVPVFLMVGRPLLERRRASKTGEAGAAA